MWNEGYISEIDYIHGYFSELSPSRLHLALLSRGVAHSMSRSPNYLELGFGQGLTLAINAATSSGHFFGTDFNPSQVANAAQLASATGRALTVFEDSFEELATRGELPGFDVIALHGIWSWVPAEARSAIIELAKSKLKPGGVLYVSYNTTPGWSPVMPLRHLMSEYARRCATGGILGRVDQSIAFVDSVIDAGAAYFANNPSLRGRLDAIKQQDKTYIAHEYFNRHWLPMSCVDVFDALAAAKLDFGASANILDNIDAISVPPAMRPVLDGIPDITLKQMVRDYAIAEQFRRDIFVKGARQLTRGELLEQILDQEFLLIGDINMPPATVRTASGEATLIADVYAPIFDAIGKTPEATFSVGTLRSGLKAAGLNEWQIWEALLILAGANFIAPASRSEDVDADIKASQRLNRELCRRSAFTANIQFLAAPRIGAAIGMSRIEQLLLLAEWDQVPDPGSFVSDALETQGERLVADGKTIEDLGEMRAYLSDMNGKFQSERVPMLRRLGILD